MDNSGFVKTMLLKPSHEHIKNLNVLIEKKNGLQLSFMNFSIFEKDPSMAHELFPKII